MDKDSRKQPVDYAQDIAALQRRQRALENSLREKEHQLRELAAVTTRAQEEEREYIAYEVHDRISQTLASVFQHLQTLESVLREDPQALKVAGRAAALVKEAIREARNIMNDLHPPVLNELGVAPIVEEDLRRFKEETACQVELQIDYPVRPPRDTEVALYRIFREALMNIRKHSGATRVIVSLTSREGHISLRVQDNGRGFNLQAPAAAKPVGGLTSMQRRARIAGGTLEVSSAPGLGTTVTAQVPMQSSKQGPG